MIFVVTRGKENWMKAVERTECTKTVRNPKRSFLGPPC